MACLPGRHPLSGAEARLSAVAPRSLRACAAGRAAQGVLMANVVVVGSQWGDEGKGKIVDWLSEQADVVVRFQGGHNAGHTLVIDGNDLQAVAAAVRRGAPGKLSVIGNGVVLDPRALVEEIDAAARAGRRGHAGQSAHRRERDADPAAASASSMRCASPSNAGTRIGTTKRGIGPAYEDKVGRRAIRLMDLADLGSLDAKIERLLAHHNALRRGIGLRRDRGEDDLRRTRRGRAEGAALHGLGLVAARRASGARASASCSKARRARCSTSTTAPIRS